MCLCIDKQTHLTNTFLLSYLSTSVSFETDTIKRGSSTPPAQSIPGLTLARQSLDQTYQVMPVMLPGQQLHTCIGPVSMAYSDLDQFYLQ